ncbi:hypothetical protein B0H17DRAFT_1247984 [Mycena rosella]|uniref:Malate dehydrogenase n=1 Tax=Mycena rosella TaxID=1033263 RepID=A0AAD7CYV9_MYCRO|nr:hypothetical protein B0H17DRAFT_1247984 [Mycena rosella]
MFAFQLLSALSSAALLVSAGPTLSSRACNTSTAVMDLPAGQTQLVSPTSAPLFVLLGVGIQNYTCSSTTSTYTSIGAVASLFDISCLEKSQFASVQTKAYTAWDSPAAGACASEIGSRVGAPKLLGFHYFVTSPSGTGISPKWDFTSTARVPTAYVIGAKTGDITAPTASATNVDWLELNGVQGALATKIFRVDTVNGQPPASCVAGSAPISVKYTAKYYLY